MSVKTETADSYGLDRASYNQGKNAKFDFSIELELSPPSQQEVQQPYVHVFPPIVGSICASDYKGIRNQDIDDRKYVVLMKEGE